MSDLEKLRQMDIEEIHKKTYISPRVLQYLLEEDFQKIGSKAKALGFVKIIERELGMDLAELREKIDQFYGERLDYDSAFVVQENGTGRSNVFLKIFVALLLLGAAGYIYFDKLAPKQTQNSETITLEENESNASAQSEESLTSLEPNTTQAAKTEKNETMNTADMNFSAASVEVNTSEANVSNQVFESNETAEVNVTVPKGKEPILEGVNPTVTIIPERKLWVGIIYLDNYKHEVHVTRKPIELNTSRDQLIVTGHSRFRIDIDGKEQNLTGAKKRRYIYRAGELEEIDLATFKKYNRGKAW